MIAAAAGARRGAWPSAWFPRDSTADNSELLPRDALHAGDRADRDALGLEDRTLLDVQLDVGVGERSGRARPGTGVADADQLVAETRSVDGPHVECVLDRHAPDEHRTAEHVGREASALLVGEEGDGDRVVGDHAVRGERLDHLEARENAEVAVEAPAGAHRVDVRTRHHRRKIMPPGPHADDVADGVDRHVETEIAHPRHHEVAPEAILFGERQTRATPLPLGTDDRADLAQGLESVGQPARVDPQIAGGDAGHRPKSKPAISARASPNDRTEPSNNSLPRSGVAAVGSPM